MWYFGDNFSWMIFNTLLALIPVALTVILTGKVRLPARLALLALWLLFLPNTIYLITDLQHLPRQFSTSSYYAQLALGLQYLILTIIGVVTYMYSLKPYEKILTDNKISGGTKDLFYIGLNCIVAFGIVLGKVQRTHSWYIFTDIHRVLNDIVKTIYSVKLLFLILFFTIVVNIIYFALRKYFLKNKMKKTKK